VIGKPNLHTQSSSHYAGWLIFLFPFPCFLLPVIPIDISLAFLGSVFVDMALAASGVAMFWHQNTIAYSGGCKSLFLSISFFPTSYHD
jgi:hypothetical protein